MSANSLASLAVRPDRDIHAVDDNDIVAPPSLRARLQRDLFLRKDRPQELAAYLSRLSPTEHRWAVELLQNLRRPAPPFRRKARARPQIARPPAPAPLPVCTQGGSFSFPARASAPASAAAPPSWWQSARIWARDKALAGAKTIIAGWGIDPDRLLALFAKVGDVVELVKNVAGSPVQFFHNLIRTLIVGAEGFWDKKWEHLRSGVVEWLTGRTGISITEFSASGMLHMLMQIVGLSAQSLEAKARLQIQKRHAEEEKKAEIDTRAAVTAQIDQAAESEAKKQGVGSRRIGALKQRVQQRAETRGVFSQVWSYVREKIRVLFQSGFRGLFESLAGDVKGLFTGLYEEILREVWQRALVEGAKLALVLAVPVGPIIKVAQTVWRGVQWLINQGGKLLSILETIADAMTDIVGGDFRSAGMKVTAVLKRLLAPLLDGLGRFVGIPNLSHKISEFCTRLATRVQNAFVGLVNRIYDRARGLFRRKPEAEDSATTPHPISQNAPPPARKWNPRAIFFFMGRGEQRERHRLREVLGTNPQLMMASNEAPMDDRLVYQKQESADPDERSIDAAVEKQNGAWKRAAQAGDPQAADVAMKSLTKVLGNSQASDYGDPKKGKRSKTVTIPDEILRAARASTHGWFLNKFQNPASGRFINSHSDETERYSTCEFVKIGLGRDLWYHLKSEDSLFRAEIQSLRRSTVRMKLFTDALANNGHLFEAKVDTTHLRDLETMVQENIFRELPSEAGRHWLLLLGLRPGSVPAPLHPPEDVNEKIPPIIRARAKEHPHGWFNASGFSDEERRFMNHHTEAPPGAKPSAAPHKRIPLFCRLAVRKNVKTSYYYHLLPNPLPADLRYNSIFETLMIAALDHQLNEKMTFEFLEFIDYEKRGLFEKRGNLWLLKPPPYRAR